MRADGGADAEAEAALGGPGAARAAPSLPDTPLADGCFSPFPESGGGADGAEPSPPASPCPLPGVRTPRRGGGRARAHLRRASPTE